MEYKCPNCGAVSQTEICPYCGTVLNRDSQDLAPEYPILQCKEARLSFFNTVFPMIFALAFGGAGVSTLVTFILRNPFAEFGMEAKGAYGIAIPFSSFDIPNISQQTLESIQTSLYKMKYTSVKANNSSAQENEPQRYVDSLPDTHVIPNAKLEITI